MSKVSDVTKYHSVSGYATEQEMSKVRTNVGVKYNSDAIRALIDGVLDGSIKFPLKPPRKSTPVPEA